MQSFVVDLVGFDDERRVKKYHWLGNPDVLRLDEVDMRLGAGCN